MSTHRTPTLDQNSAGASLGHLTMAAVLVLILGFGFGGCGDDAGDAGGDARTADVGTDTVQDTGNSNVLLPNECPYAERRCDGQTAQQCIDGAWQSLFDCPAGKVCSQGACTDGCSCDGRQCGDDGCGNSCGTCDSGTCNGAGQCEGAQCGCNGATCGLDACGNACGTCPSGFSCVSGQCQTSGECDCNGARCGYDGCGNLCGTCPTGAVCQAGVCGVSNAKECGDVIDCVVNNCVDVPDNQYDSCESGCLVGADATATQEFNTYLACIEGCGNDLMCFANYCSSGQAACFFDGTGFGGCFDILDCMDLCADGDSECIFGCYEASTFAAQTALLALNNCVSAACPNAASGDPCIDAALSGVCATHLNTCSSN